VAIAQQIQQLGMQQQYHQVRSLWDDPDVFLNVSTRVPSFSMLGRISYRIFHSQKNAAILELSQPHIKTNWDSN